ncbi:MAG: VCBS repeat-containing protein [Blautia sp.]|nr:VCBS repeat-containing protein [Lachnoclostridium sp.]MCM1212342.1 VCBS repeat-containing protein [Blautia sp.]
MKSLKSLKYITTVIIISLLMALCDFYFVAYAAETKMPIVYAAEIEASAGYSAETTEPEGADVLAAYREYQKRLAAAEYRSDIAGNGFQIVEEQIFPIEMEGYTEVSLIPAFDRQYHRLALFFADENGKVIYRTEQLAANSRVLGEMKQPDCEIAAVSFRDLDEDGRMDIILIVSCEEETDAGMGKTYKVGDVLFQNKLQLGFYRDYRITDKINRFGMNKSAEFITAFVRDGRSTENLYTATTLDELFAHGLKILWEQCYFRTFGKLGRLQVVPGTYRISNYDVFMIYLVNEQGNIISGFSPMGDYDNLYALKGINCRDIDGDGLKDLIVLARYSYEGEQGELVVESDYSIYYQRTGGFSADTDIKDRYRCGDEDTMEILVEKARAYWGWTGKEGLSDD